MRVSPVTSDSLKELSIIDMDQVGTDKPPQYVSLLVIHPALTLAYLSLLRGAILDKDGENKSDDENDTKKKSRAAGPVEIVRA